jgi:UDP-N-acetylglucosamine transferase subunit ALG13
VAAEAKEASSLIFVTVGTDHHPFHRLMDWLDGWLAGIDAEAVRCVVQCGATPPPRFAEWKAFLGRAEMDALLKEATTVVCHGGPGTIMACRRSGIRPIVVPRRRSFGEHVDDHQLAFTQILARKGEIELVDGREEFGAALESALSNPAAFRRGTELADPADSARRFEELIDRLMAGPAGKRRRRWR